MAIQVLTSVSTTVTKTLGATDNLIDGLSKVTEIFARSLNVADLENQIESFVEINELLAKATSLTPDQLALITNQLKSGL
jgi:hypothetical protein